MNTVKLLPMIHLALIPVQVNIMSQGGYMVFIGDILLSISFSYVARVLWQIK